MQLIDFLLLLEIENKTFIWESHFLYNNNFLDRGEKERDGSPPHFNHTQIVVSRDILDQEPKGS